MKKLWLLGLFILLATGMALGINASRQKATAQEFVPGELIVQFKPHISSDQAKRLIAQLGANPKETLGRDTLFLVTFSESISPKEMVARFQKLEEVDFAEPNGTVEALFWDLLAPPEVWAEPTSGKLGAEAEIRVAVIDTAMDGNHPVLAGKTVAGYNFVKNSTDTQSGTGIADWHATGVAGRVLDGAGDANVKIMPVTALSPSGSGTWANVIKSVNYAADNGAQIINLSLGGSGYSEALQQAIDRANQKGVIVVAAAGNTGRDQAFFPAAYRGVISVAATDENGKKTNFSTYHSTVDISAPGQTQKLLTHGGGTRQAAGTSFSSPFIAGMVAMLKSAFPFLTGSQCEEVLRDRAHSLEDKNDPKYKGKMGAGFLNLLDVGAWMDQIRKGAFRFPWQKGSYEGDSIRKILPQPKPAPAAPNQPWLARGKGHKGTYVLTPSGEVVLEEKKK